MCADGVCVWGGLCWCVCVCVRACVRACVHDAMMLFCQSFQSIDQVEEKVVLQRTEASLATDRLKSCVPDSAARYHLFLFKHRHNGDYMESVGTLLSHTTHAHTHIHNYVSYSPIISHQSSSTLVLGTSVLSRNACSTRAARIPWWTK